ncbi:diguanylate cyclase [Marinimicrobium alkaliphilum]|uniref:diguanylate cyclase n=1 Tax=Marinimicrobium alkaliphilum TaxID=2202654 RepID=UPI000DB96D1B|nr:diguanylate cyclase [Marinimicrobium alkaliphilum]
MRQTRFPSLTGLLASLFFSCLASTPALGCSLKAGDDVPTLVFPLRHEARHDHASYYIGLLELILVKTENDFGPCELRIYDQELPQTRHYLHLEQRMGIDIIDATSNFEHSERFSVIPVPIFKGLMGYRVAFVRAEDQEAFGEIDGLEALSQWRAGQGGPWPDVDVLRRNGLPVVTAHTHRALYRMLRAGRFDYLPRGAHEIKDELENFDTEGLVVESRQLFAYPSPSFFHVHPDNTYLANRIKTGLQRAIESGAFDDFFYNHEMIQYVFDDLGLAEREVHFMCNPRHTDDPWLADKRYWVIPWPEDLCTETPEPGELIDAGA